MFYYIRYFSAISFVLVLVAAFFVGKSFKEIAGGDLIQLVNNNSTSLAQGMINTVWRQDHATIELYSRFAASGVPQKDWPRYQGYAEMTSGFRKLSKDVFKYFEDMPIVGVNVYMADGTRIISVDQSHIVPADTLTNVMNGSQGGQKLQQGALEIARRGKVSHLMDVDGTFTRPDGTLAHGTLIRTTVPILAEHYADIVAGAGAKPVEGMVEVQFDITEPWKRLDLFHWIGTGGIVVIFAILISLLTITTNKAEAIIARQHEANIELAGQAAAAQAENRDKSQFLANVSHELRTPLNAIIGFSEFIKSERNGPIANERYAEYIRDIHASGVHLLSLINDILDYSKAEADKLELDISEVDVTKSIRNCLRLMLPRAEQAQVHLVDDVPREHFILFTDQKKFKQIMLNLLSNAVKFTPAGGSVSVTMWQNVHDESVGIEVKDTGIGIAPKDISRAMAPFGQVDNALSRKYEGTGLGLPLTKKFVEIMGGSFKIESEVGAGTTISFTLPKEAPPDKRKPQDGTITHERADETDTPPDDSPDQGA
jgi:two-component system cell cycle sensor histidine kinase PleC